MDYRGLQVDTANVGSSCADGSVIGWADSHKLNDVKFTKVRFPSIGSDEWPSATNLRKQTKSTSTTTPPGQIDVSYPVTQFIECHKRFAGRLDDLINKGSNCCNPYDSTCDIIFDYGQHLAHFPDDISDIFFDFNDLLSEVLLVSKRRPIEITTIQDTLKEMNSIYYKIYSLMLSRDRGAISSIANELSCLKDEINRQGLLPTEDEIESELSETMSVLNEKEKEELACMFSWY